MFSKDNSKLLLQKRIDAAAVWPNLWDAIDEEYAKILNVKNDFKKILEVGSQKDRRYF